MTDIFLTQIETELNNIASGDFASLLSFGVSIICIIIAYYIITGLMSRSAKLNGGVDYGKGCDR